MLVDRGLINEIVDGCVNSYLGRKRTSLYEAKQVPKLSWFLENLNKGKYDITIYNKMHGRDYKRLLAKYVNFFPLSDDKKQVLYDCMVNRYKMLLTCISNTSQICISIMEGMFDEDIAECDYSWFDNVEEIIDKYCIEYFIEERIAIGKNRRLFYGLPRKIDWDHGPNDYNINLSSIMDKDDLIKRKK